MAIKSRYLLLLLAGCASPSPWLVDSIAAEAPFTSSRLRYRAESHSPLTFEMVRLGERMEAFLSLTRFRFSHEALPLTLTIGGETYRETVHPHEGKMRVRLSPEMTKRLILALQDGEKIAILLDGYEETLYPDRFAGSFDSFRGEGNFFDNLLKGPFP